MDIMNILGGLMQSKAAPSANRRMKNVLSVDSEELRSLGTKQGLDVQDLLKGLAGAGKESDSVGGMLGQVLGQVENAVGGKKNLAVGGLGVLVGSLLGGGKKSASGALGGGLMALVAAMAMNALQDSGKSTSKAPVGLMVPETEEEKQDLQSGAELVVAAMINAVKADGRVDEEEYRFIVGKLEEAGVPREEMNYILAELHKPMDTEWIIGAAKGSPELAAQVYSATLMSIEVDTPAERAYLRELASGLELPRDVVRTIEQMVGMDRM